VGEQEIKGHIRNGVERRLEAEKKRRRKEEKGGSTKKAGEIEEISFEGKMNLQ